jgi:hypothetical protein
MVRGRPLAGRKIRTGIAISLTEICAADVRLTAAHGGLGWRRPLSPPEPGSIKWPSLEAALEELATVLGTSGGHLTVALMPPLTEVRRIELPPVSRDQAQQLLSRNAARYFVTAREPQVVGTANGKRPTRAGPSPILGAAASARLVGAIHAAAHQAGWVVDAVVPADVGWGAAATALWPAFSRGTSHVVVHHDDRTDLLRLDAGQLSAVRRFRPGSADSSLIESALAESRLNGTPPRVGSLGANDHRVALASSLGRDSATVSLPPVDWTTAASDPMYIAASFATADNGLTLHAGSVANLESARGRRISLSILGLSLALLATAAGLHLWGLNRELAAVNAERESLRPELQSTLARRSTFESSNQKLSTLFAAHREAPYLSGVIASVTDALPEDAYLLSLRARRDTLIIDGLARNAAAAFDAIELIPELANVQSIAGIQRQLQDDGTALEHFTIQARMLLAGPPPDMPRLRGNTP